MNDAVRKVIADTIEVHKKLVSELEADCLQIIADAAKLIVDSLKQNGRIYICGNGGSAADSQHIAGELVGRFKRERKALPAVALSTDTSVMTCIANDYGYDDIFRRQVEAFVTEADVLWAFSTSGSSTNVIRAAKLAKDKDAKVLAFTGRPGSELEALADVCICANSRSTARSQEIQQLAYHIICDLVEESFCDN